MKRRSVLLSAVLTGANVLLGRVLEIFDVTVSAPRLRLLPQSNRIATDFDIGSVDRLLRSQHSGMLGLSFGLRFEASDNTLRMTQVRVEQLQIDAAPALLQRQLERIGMLLAEQALDDQVIHTLRPKDVEAVQGRGYRPSELRVTPSGVLVTLLPIEAR
jgi:hypothetical protein